MNLSAHFTREEFEFSATATRLRLDNTIPQHLLPRAQDTADMLERIRAALSAAKGQDVGIRITSGYRGTALNAAVKGQSKSDHLTASAADIVAPGFGTPFELARFIAAHMRELGVGQVIHEFGRWVHVSPLLPEKIVNMAITIDHSGTRCGICEVEA
jgi:zinc D-Ala-D-Ala carboxypeptidase